MLAEETILKKLKADLGSVATIENAYELSSVYLPEAIVPGGVPAENGTAPADGSAPSAAAASDAQERGQETLQAEVLANDSSLAWCCI